MDVDVACGGGYLIEQLVGGGRGEERVGAEERGGDVGVGNEVGPEQVAVEVEEERE